MKELKVTRALREFAIAALISEGEYLDEHTISIPFYNHKKILYLNEMLSQKQLKDYVIVNMKKRQMDINVKSLPDLKNEWYMNNIKTFSLMVNPDLISLESIIMAMNLFGNRKLETITIPTTVDKAFMRTLSMCMEVHLKVNVVPGNGHYKIYDIPNLVLHTIDHTLTIHSAELTNFLNVKEQKKLKGCEV